VSASLPGELRRYLAYSYPHNHDYRVLGRRLWPRWRLWRRLRRLRGPLEGAPRELLDLSSCKGFFVLDAARHPACERTLGIDVHRPDLEASRAVAAHLGLERARFEELTLGQLAGRIEEFGGPFAAALLVNTYPYLYFGSPRSEDHLPDHDGLFEQLATVVSGRLVFSNRVELDALPSNVRRRAQELGLEAGYDTDTILAAAEHHFRVRVERPLGRIPLWVLDRR